MPYSEFPVFELVDPPRSQVLRSLSLARAPQLPRLLDGSVGLLSK